MSTPSEPQHSTDPAAEQKLQKTLAQTLQQAIEHQKSGQIKAAEDLYRAILEVQPKHPAANHNLGTLTVQAHRPSVGLPFLQAALEAQPDREQHWLSYLDALIQTGQMEVASQALKVGRKHGLQGAKVEQLASRLLALKQTTQQAAEESPTPPIPTEENPLTDIAEPKETTGIRFFRYSQKTYNRLDRNPKHRFAQTYALNIYRADAIYSFIPKNGCSTLRTSIAYANGCIENKNDFNWIHDNNGTFSASLSELVKAQYTFTFLRCPFSRLASVYLDKIASNSQAVRNITELVGKEVEFSEMSFAFFIRSLIDPRIKSSNPHWMAQVDFLVYKKYDDYFSMEEFKKAEEILEDKINLKIIDARKLTKHGLDRLSLVDGDSFPEMSPVELAQMKADNYSPAPKSLYNEELIAIVRTVYKEDILLYRTLFGDKNLMFA